MENLAQANQVLEKFYQLTQLNQPLQAQPNGYKVGVDLGTSSIVLVVLDENDEPLFGAFEFANVIVDGLVVDYQKSVEIVRRLKEQAESVLGFTLKKASGAVPPGTIGNNRNVVANVIESAGFLADHLVDEPTAAAKLLKMDSGAVIDVGGGTTGISIFEDSKALIVADEPTGGHHMSLVLAGYHHVTLDEAEKIKRDPAKDAENFTIVRPVIQRMAEIVRQTIIQYPKLLENFVVVGGASSLKEFESELSHYLSVEVVKPKHPEFVTPLGIAMSSEVIER